MNRKEMDTMLEIAKGVKQFEDDHREVSILGRDGILFHDLNEFFVVYVNLNGYGYKCVIDDDRVFHSFYVNDTEFKFNEPLSDYERRKELRNAK